MDVESFRFVLDPRTDQAKMVLSIRSGDEIEEQEESIDRRWVTESIPDADGAPVRFPSGRQYSFDPDLLESLREQRQTLLRAMAGHGQQVTG